MLLGAIAAGAMVAYFRVSAAEQNASENLAKMTEEKRQREEADFRKEAAERLQRNADAARHTAEQQASTAVAEKKSADEKVVQISAESEKALEEENKRLRAAMERAQSRRPRPSTTPPRRAPPRRSSRRSSTRRRSECSGSKPRRSTSLPTSATSASFDAPVGLGIRLPDTS